MRTISEDPGGPDRRLGSDPVAVVGLSGRFPKARDIREFWDNIVAGRDCSGIVPDSWWRPDRYYDPDPFTEDRTYCRRGGFLTPELFDPLEFAMPPNTVESTGLVQLLSLVVAKETLSDARRGREDWCAPSRTGVVLGVCGTNSTLIPLAARLLVPEILETMLAMGVPEKQAKEIVRIRLAALPPWTEDSFPGILANVVSGRVANRLDLGAANHTVDAACASSLAAVRCAVDELISRRADVMLTGGCDADNSIVSFMCFSKTPALSPTGTVRPFDAEADGTLVGEGIGMLALRRLADAERDGDRIYAVLKGLGSSSDGNAQSIYAPCGAGQSAALRRAYADAGCPPATVGLIEAHGTGTPTGDEVELTALNDLLATPDDRHFVAVGSVKSQIGHTKAAAGAAGLIKAALALHHKVLPPTINVTTPHAQAVRPDGALYVNTTARPWVRDPSGTPRRAGVSAFGFGGVNYHAVLEEHQSPPAEREYALHETPSAYLWHAPDRAELLRRLERGDPPDPGPAPAPHARLGLVATGRPEYEELLALAVARLRDHPGDDTWNHPRGIHYRTRALPSGTKTGALFAGQGSQYPGMGLRAALALPPVRAAFDAANAHFPAADSLARAVFPPPGTGDATRHAERLRRTSHAQPAIGALSTGQYRYLRELGFAPHALLGHSFGELTALWAAGVLDDAGFTALAHARGQAMARPPGPGHDPGAMAAARMSRDALAELLAQHPELTVCNHNAPDEQTVGGPTAAVRHFTDACAARGLPVRLLPVAAAFHTPHIAHAAREFAAACAEAAFAPPALPVHAGTAGASYGDDADANRRTLVEQLLRPVDFAARLEEMYADGIRVFVEFGPRRILTGFVERTLGAGRAEVVACDAGPGTDACAALKQAAVRLAVLGLPLTGDRYTAPPRPERRTPSKVARRLDGPFFAMEKRRGAYEELLARHTAAGSRVEPESAPAPATPPARTGAADPLTRAAADHLAAHARYVDSEVRTTEQLGALLARGAAAGRMDASLLAAIQAVADHSMALGETHARAAEAVSGLLRPPSGPPEHDGPPRPVPAAVDAVMADAVTAGAATPEAVAPDAVTAEPRPDTEPPVEGPHAERRSALAELWAAQKGEVAATGTTDIGSLDPDEVEGVFRAVIAEKTGYDVDMIEPDMDIQADLGIDSLKQVEIGAEMWRRYPVIARSEMYRFSEARTVRELTAIAQEVIAEPRPQLLSPVVGTALGSAWVTPVDLPAVDVREDAYPESPHALLIDDAGGLGRLLADALTTRGWRVSRLALPGAATETPGLTDWAEDTLAARLAELLADGTRLDLCVLPVSREPDDSDDSGETNADRIITRLRHAILVAKHTRPALEAAARTGTRAGLVTVTRLDGALGYAGSGGDTAAALAGGLGGLVKTLALEATTLFCRALDLAPGLSDEDAGAAFATELADLAGDVREVGVDTTGRRAPRVSGTPWPRSPVTATEVELSEDDVLLVTGGAGGVTAWCVEELVRAHRCGCVLLGRTPLTDEPAWAAALDGPEELRAALEARARDAGEDPGEEPARTRVEEELALLVRQRGIRAFLATLRSYGAEAVYAAADVRDPDAVAAALAPYADRITGVLHGAGVLRDRPLAETDPDGIAAVVDTKPAGLRNVLAPLDAARLRHLVLFTSVAGIWGNLRQADYALANEALNRFGCAWQAARPHCRVVPIAFGPWTEGMAADLHQIFTEVGVPVLSREEGCARFLELMAPGRGGGVALVGPTEALFQRCDPLPDAGLTAYRVLTGLGDEPVLRAHRVVGVPILPMTAAVGWALGAVERAHGGARPVVECRDIRIAQAITFPPGHPERFRVRLERDARQAVVPFVRVSVDDAGEQGKPRFEGRFRLADRPGEAPVTSLPPRTFTDAPHPGYRDGRLFHGAALNGLRDVLEESPGHLVITARMPDPAFARGAFAGRLYSPALADLLMQGALLTLLALADGEEIPVPVSAERLELFGPLPDDEPFVITVDVDEATTPTAMSFFSQCALTASAPDGRLLQRWSGVRTVWIEPAALADGIAARGAAGRG
ncbi:beta-ketoacyl synthase N-terminal-like domain-containing protein [Streptomyces abikoensis]|uniref:beta-ketoacyl synthase N-terminal-like domain-containing protein n=1 Tax=Streptomyces abikoensis TaxID=97398 RepID=UPI00371E79FF